MGTKKIARFLRFGRWTIIFLFFILWDVIVRSVVWNLEIVWNLEADFQSLLVVVNLQLFTEYLEKVWNQRPQPGDGMRYAGAAVRVLMHDFDGSSALAPPLAPRRCIEIEIMIT